MESGKQPHVLTLRSRKNSAQRMVAFLRWCRNCNLDWRDLDYIDHIRGGYQLDLLKGTKSAATRALKRGTVNQYVDEACGFLTWAHERGYRVPVRIPVRGQAVLSSNGTHSRGHLPKEVKVRADKLSLPEVSLDYLPSAESVYKWLASVADRHPVKALVFELIITTGCRIDEAHQLRVTCFPRKSEWAESVYLEGRLPLQLQYGVKGPKVLPQEKLSVRTRTVFVPIDLAERIERYMMFTRPNLLARFRRTSGYPAETDRLWLGEKKSLPVSYQMLWKTWTTSSMCPPGWHPHAGRHYFAVEEIVRATVDLMSLHGLRDPAEAPIGWLQGLMQNQVRLILSPLLGHTSEATTMRYLRAAHRRLATVTGHPSLAWNSKIDRKTNKNAPAETN
jgi:integrase